MSGSPSHPPLMNDRTALDALSRTIEGLEARIEGLMGAAGGLETPRPQAPAAAVQSAARPVLAERSNRLDRAVASREANDRPSRAEAPAPAPRADPFAEIRQRQRILGASRDRSHSVEQEAPVRPPLAPRSAEPVASRQPVARVAADSRPAADAMTEIAQALVSLRHDLKKDIADGVAREMGALRAEIRTIKGVAEDHNFADSMRADLTRLADSIDQLANAGASHGSEAAALKAEFDDLRALMDGLAREESVRGMESRWDSVEDRLQAIDTSGLQEELVALAYRIDDIKRQLGGMNDSPAVHALEEKLISIATAMEQFGNLMQPRDRAMTEQFTAIDTRLDEISRAIAASGRSAANTADPALIQRLENRISSLADQIDVMSSEAMLRFEPTMDLASRIEGLSSRIDDMAHAETAVNLEERLNELSRLMESSYSQAPQPDLTVHLSDISRKIDALDQGAVNDVLAERLEQLARRIDQIDMHPPASAFDETVVVRLESRLADIASRLEESTAAAPTDSLALRGLEDQIAHLSELLSEPRNGFPVEFDQRMSAIEDYMSTNDEYVIEAARQAAETVVQAYSRQGAMNGAAPAAEMSALAALAEDLRHLEDISRSSDERTHRTFEALHNTLVQIADRLDNMERSKPAARMPVAEFNPPPLEYADGPQARAAAPSQKSGPVIRTASAAVPMATVAAARAAADTAVPGVAEVTNADAIPMDAETKARIKAAVKSEGGKPSLFAALGKRLRPGRKAETEASTDRQVIDPTPSIDSGDMMHADEANELLEPGSGAPDIKKILERVRASQNAARNGASKPQTENERADYIAAARRAAQAAAMEVDQSRTAPTVKGPGKTGTFARYRRPILLAVGAALLALMAFPVVHSLTGKQAPAPAEVSALTSAATPAPAATDPAAAAQPQPATGPTQVAPAQAGMATSADPLTSPVPAGSDPASQPLASPGAPAPGMANATPSATTAPDVAAANTAGDATTPAAPAAVIAVPDSIQPPALADAARQGDALALFEIGARFTEGRGLPTDLKQAASWYQLSADKGFAPAQYRLASMYEKGNGLDRDLAKAKQYYQLAADQGNASAMHNLAVLFASGAAGAQDYAAAVDWFTKAANFGVSDSQFNLAILYARGNGVKQDLTESYKWFAIAAKGGDKDAAQKRDEVANSLKPDQLQAAKEKVDLWKQQPLDDKSNRADIPDAWAGKSVHTGSVDMKKAVRNIQAILNNNGFDAGTPDGNMGDKTVSALKSFQKSVGLTPDGKITDQVVKQLLARNKPA
ncbi:peptidoglycan-binding protein [Rhizobium tumorigenes]|uniref:peptidoglycan-binding protein n=1 Tax=Rhizobium tumorigenes TaxID=2041385 RepID=UPI00241C17B4|nr:peptidoglycan-binding protein [Rhizobium tumorigenes]WFS01210.1 peptidoglycan-binding protein [Rhizobium tumorigenes]